MKGSKISSKERAIFFKKYTGKIKVTIKDLGK